MSLMVTAYEGTVPNKTTVIPPELESNPTSGRPLQASRPSLRSPTSDRSNGSLGLTPYDTCSSSTPPESKTESSLVVAITPAKRRSTPIKTRSMGFVECITISKDPESTTKPRCSSEG